MSQIKKIPRKDLAQFVTIMANAYPGIKVVSDDDKKKMRQRFLKILAEDPNLSFYGLYRKGKLLGGMSLLDFTMTVLSAKAKVGGVGSVAVDLTHKKEKICKEMIEFFHQHYLERGACMTALYPFRPDFYRKMGYGYGTKLNRYRIKPGDLPSGGNKENVRSLQKRDYRAMVDCYDRVAARTHGMMKKCQFEIMRLERPGTRIIGYKRGRKTLGYAVFSFEEFEKGNFISNDLVVRELIYENREAFLGLVEFLRTQADQINRIVMDTHDEYLHYLPRDPRNDSGNLIPSVYHESNVQGVGIMYRVIDVRGLFEVLKKHSFGNHSLILRISIADSFLKDNRGSYLIHFTDGKPKLKKSGDPDCEIRLDVSDFSSLIMGAVDFRSLHLYGLADISDEKHLDTVNGLFMTDVKPSCTTDF